MRPASEILCPASQYFAMRGCTPAAAAQHSAVLSGQIPRAARTWTVGIVVQSVAPKGKPLPRFCIDATPIFDSCNDMTNALPERLQNLPAFPDAERRQAGYVLSTGLPKLPVANMRGLAK